MRLCQEFPSKRCCFTPLPAEQKSSPKHIKPDYETLIMPTKPAMSSTPTSESTTSHGQLEAAAQHGIASFGQRPSVLPRSSMESTATTLPTYSERPDQPPAYDSMSVRQAPSSTPPDSRLRATSSRNSQPSGPNAVAVSAMLATSSSSTDKMHSHHPKKVDDWNEDPTYKSKLASMTGSSRRWNYFGADIGPNPFKRRSK